jgi:hypothetical protein
LLVAQTSKPIEIRIIENVKTHLDQAQNMGRKCEELIEWWGRFTMGVSSKQAYIPIVQLRCCHWLQSSTPIVLLLFRHRLKSRSNQNRIPAFDVNVLEFRAFDEVVCCDLVADWQERNVFETREIKQHCRNKETIREVFDAAKFRAVIAPLSEWTAAEPARSL